VRVSLTVRHCDPPTIWTQAQEAALESEQVVIPHTYYSIYPALGLKPSMAAPHFDRHGRFVSSDLSGCKGSFTAYHGNIIPLGSTAKPHS